MKHKWLKQPDIKRLGMPSFKIWICAVCGCEKSQGNWRFSEARYDRSGQSYDHYIECYDDEAEKLKTID